MKLDKQLQEEERLFCDIKGRLVSTNSQLEDCMLRIKHRTASPHPNLLSHLKSLSSQLDNLRSSLDNNIPFLQKHTNNLKRKRKVEDCSSKKKSKKKQKIGIFIRVVSNYAPLYGRHEAASCLYKIEMDSDKYLNPSPPLMSYKDRFKEPKHKSKPHGIKPVFSFNFKQGNPLGMACVPFGPKHHLYLMGGSITYNLYFTKSMTDASNLYETVNTTDPDMYPPNVYVFDCFTCQLLSPQDSPPPMNSGKSADPFTFVENRKLYVLSSTKVPKELNVFEVFNPDSRSWTILDNPPYDWGKLGTPFGSVLIDGVFFISYGQEGFRSSPIHIFSYRIANKEWKKLSVCRPLYQDTSVAPNFERDSVFVHKKIYSANVRELMLDFPVLSYGPIPSTAKLNAHDFDVVGTPNFTPIFPSDACWPIYDNGKMEDEFSARLVHLGSLLEGTRIDSTCFGFVHIGFAAFEALNHENTSDSDTYTDAAESAADLYLRHPDECGSFFKAKTLHACHFYCSGKFQQSSLNAVCALFLS